MILSDRYGLGDVLDGDILKGQDLLAIYIPWASQ